MCVCTAQVGAAFLVVHKDYARSSVVSGEAGVSSPYLPLVLLFYLSHLVASTIISVVEIAVAAAVQGWCLRSPTPDPES